MKREKNIFFWFWLSILGCYFQLTQSKQFYNSLLIEFPSLERLPRAYSVKIFTIVIKTALVSTLRQGILKGEVSLYCWPPVGLVWISCMPTGNFWFYLQNRLNQTSQTGGQPYSDTSPFSIPWLRAWAAIEPNYFLCHPSILFVGKGGAYPVYPL